jgi:hypothetical protein
MRVKLKNQGKKKVKSPRCEGGTWGTRHRGARATNSEKQTRIITTADDVVGTELFSWVDGGRGVFV